MIDSVDALFDAFGGPAKVGVIIGKSTEHAAGMRRRGSIAVDYWPRIVAEAGTRGIAGVTYETLTLMHARPEGVQGEAERVAS